MIELSKNKDMANTPKKTKEIGAKEDYFFPGGTKYLPQTVQAESQEEANEIYEKSKAKV
ncbi:MAG: hypothetical protein M3P98_01560 [bacterium]|nr:hypothetical protein [bacterium]